MAPCIKITFKLENREVKTLYRPTSKFSSFGTMLYINIMYEMVHLPERIVDRAIPAEK